MPEDGTKIRKGAAITATATAIAAVIVAIWGGLDELSRLIGVALAIRESERWVPEAVNAVGPIVALVAGVAVAVVMTGALRTAWAGMPHLLRTTGTMVAVGAGVIAAYAGLRLSEHPVPAPAPNAVARNKSDHKHGRLYVPSRLPNRSAGGRIGSSTGQSKQQSASSSVATTSSSGSQRASAQAVHEVATRSPEQHHESAPPQTYTRPVSESHPESQSLEGGAHETANPSSASSTVEGDASSGKGTGGPEGSGN